MYKRQVDVGGVGYEVLIPLSCYDQLPGPGKETTLLIHHHITESAQALYGFVKEEERDLFRLLIGRVSGVGPKIGLAVLGGMGVEAFQAAVVDSDIGAISAVKGLGKKTAERIVLELKDKVGITQAWEASRDGKGGSGEAAGPWADASLALISLGYRAADAERVLGKIRKGGMDDATVDRVLREALRQLN